MLDLPLLFELVNYSMIDKNVMYLWLMLNWMLIFYFIIG